MSEAALHAPAPARDAWWRYWFGEASLVRLAGFRIALYLAAYYALFQFRLGVMQHADGLDVTWARRDWNPIYLLDLLHLGPPGPMAARVLFWSTYGAILCALTGLWTRWSALLVAALLTYWIAVVYSFGKPHHDCIALVFGLWTMPLAPAGARLSLDARLAHRAQPGRPPPERAEWAALPLRFTAITIVLGYFFAGATKLATSGLEWVNGYTLQAHMLSFAAPASAFFSRHVELVRLMSIGLLGVQILFPFVLFLPRTRWFFLPMGIFFHLTAWATMDTGPFLSLWFPYACFIAWEELPDHWRRLLRSSGLRKWSTLTLLGLCAIGVAWIYFRFFPLAANVGLAVAALAAIRSPRESFSTEP